MCTPIRIGADSRGYALDVRPCTRKKLINSSAFYILTATMSTISLVVTLLLCAAAVTATETLSVRTRPDRCLLLKLEPTGAVTLEAVQPASAR